MSFYSKASLRAGPFRYELTNSGISISTAFPGLRQSISPRGHFITIEKGDSSFRATELENIDIRHAVASTQNRAHPEGVIDTINVLELQDSSSTDLILELNNKHKKAQFFHLVVSLSVLIFVAFIGVKAQAWILGIVLLLAVIFAFLSKFWDDLAKRTVVFYKLDSDSEHDYQAICDAFDELARCSNAWHIEATSKVSNLQEWKTQAGASSLVQRKPTKLKYQLPPFLSTNLKTPSIPVGRQTLYFFPDRILVYEGKKIGTVSYQDIQIRLENTRFIESGGVPNDAQVVDHTWKYLNKKVARIKNTRTISSYLLPYIANCILVVKLA
ncbi:MAG TPA: hypothetical protein VI451_04345 [Anaerolineales bacterium]|nr:hypothetical protein [Anaerolineales bacterium]